MGDKMLSSCSLAEPAMVAAIILFLLPGSFADFCQNGLDCGRGRCCRTDANSEFVCCEQLADGNVYIVSPGGVWLRQQWSLAVGLLIAGILTSVVIFVLLCLFCNGCWLHRWRRHDVYTEDFPAVAATVYLRPPYVPAPPYVGRNSYVDYVSESSTSSKSRVRFKDDEDQTAPTKSILKSAA